MASRSKVKVPAGTQSGRRFRLQGKGMPVLRSKQNGDMYVQVVVETPQNLTKRQRELLQEFHKLSSTETQPESTGFFARVKELFDLGSKAGTERGLTRLSRSRLGAAALTGYALGSHNSFTTIAAMRPQTSLAEKKGLRLDDEVRFIRSWLEKPLAIGAVTPSGRVLARTMARYVDTRIPGPVIELGPGTGPVTEALVARGVHPSRLVLVEFNPDLLPPAALALSGGDRRAGRRLCSEAAAWRSAGTSRPLRWFPGCRC